MLFTFLIIKAQQLLKEQSDRGAAQRSAQILEENIESQLAEVVARSENVLEAMREKLNQSQEKNQEFSSFVQVLHL